MASTNDKGKHHKKAPQSVVTSILKKENARHKPPIKTRTKKKGK